MQKILVVIPQTCDENAHLFDEFCERVESWGTVVVIRHDASKALSETCPPEHSPESFRVVLVGAGSDTANMVTLMWSYVELGCPAALLLLPGVKPPFLFNDREHYFLGLGESTELQLKKLERCLKRPPLRQGGLS